MTQHATAPRPSKLAAALALANQGFDVFPLIPNDKRPLISGWQSKATRDPERIREWWADEPDANIGMLTERLLVVDIDPRKGGSDAFQALKLTEEFPDSLASATAGGGVHIIYALPDDVTVSGGNNLFGQGLDIKSHGGFIVAPGSRINNKTYMWVPGQSPDDRDPITPPPWMLARCTRPNARSIDAGKIAVEEDDTALARAEHWLAKHAPEAVEGERDNKAFAVAAKLYDFGLTPESTREYLAQWNEGWCHPPLDNSDLERIVASAAKNRQTAIGSKHPNAPGFEAVEIDETKKPDIRVPAVPPADADGYILRPVLPLEASSIPPRPWVIPGFACRGRVSMIAGPGGVAKSTYMLMAAVAAVTARGDICGFEVPTRTRTAVWNQEDDLDEMNRRLIAIMQAFDVKWDDLKDENGEPMLFLNSGVEFPLLLAQRTDVGTIRKAKIAAQLAKEIKERGIGLAMFDPLVELHEAVENDNVQMRSVMSVVRDIAVHADCATMLAAHTKKPPVASSDGFAGEMDAARGASSQFGVIRIGATLFSASPKDAKIWNMTGSHLDYVRLDIAKNNLARRTGEPIWFQRDGIDIGGFEGGDEVGILRPIALTERVRETTVDLAEMIASAIYTGLRPGVFFTPAEIKACLSEGDSANWPDGPNFARDVKKVFNGRTKIATNVGILEMAAGAGRGGTRFKLVESANSSTLENPDELIS